MRKLLAAAASLGIVAFSTSANADVTITPGTTFSIPGSNDFQSQLNGLGLFLYTTTGATLTLNQGSTINFEFLGSESGFDDTFSAAGVPSYTEHSTIENHFGAPINLGSAFFNAGSLAGLLNFTSSGGASATVGQDGFGIFLPRGTEGAISTNVFYLGYDDQITNQDDNHDDFIVRATVVPSVPEPATWAMMLLGFGAIGFTMRRRKVAMPQLA